MTPGSFFAYTDATFGWAGYLLLEFEPNYANGTIRVKGIEAPISQILKSASPIVTAQTAIAPVMTTSRTTAPSTTPTTTVAPIIYSTAQAFEDSGTKLIPVNNAAPTGWFEVISSNITPRTAISGVDGIFELDADLNIERKTTASATYEPRAALEGGLGSSSLYFAQIAASDVYLSSAALALTRMTTYYVTTADASDTVLFNRVLIGPSNTRINVQIVAVYSTGTKGAAFRRTAFVNCQTDGTVTIFSQVPVGSDLSDDTNLKATFQTNTSSVDLIVNGLTGATTKWACVVSIKEF